MYFKVVVILVVIAAVFGDLVPCHACKRPHEEYNQCGTACPATCDNLGYAIRCVNKCVKGCFCQDGYVRNEQTHECVLPSECPVKENKD